MDRVDYYFQHYRESKRELEIAKDLLVNYKPISEDAFLYSLATHQSTEEKVVTTRSFDKAENIALSYQEKFRKEELEYRRSLYEKYCNLKAELDFFIRAIYSVDEILKDIIVDLVLEGLTWEELIPKHSVSRMTISRYRKKALTQVKAYYRFAGKSLSLNG